MAFIVARWLVFLKEDGVAKVAGLVEGFEQCCERDSGELCSLAAVLV